MSADIANEIAYVFIKEVMRILKVDNVEIIDKAIPIYQDVNVSLVMNLAIGLVLGAMIGVGIVFLMYFLDQTIKVESDVEKHLDLPVIGEIAIFDEVESRRKGRQKWMSW